MSESAKALGILSKFPYLGKEYGVAPMSIEIRANYSVWLEHEAWAGALRSRQHVPVLEYRENMREVGRDIAAGVYGANSQVAAKSLESQGGFIQMLWLRMKKATPEAQEITVEWVTKLVEDQSEEIQNFLIALDTDPNSLAPSTATT